MFNPHPYLYIMLKKKKQKTAALTTGSKTTIFLPCTADGLKIKLAQATVTQSLRSAGAIEDNLAF